MLPLKKGIDFK